MSIKQTIKTAAPKTRLNITRYLLLLVITLACVLTVSGCMKKYLPGTTIVDNKETRIIFELVHHYQHAVKTKDLPQLMAFISKDFYEDNGTTIGDDDYTYQTLEKKWADIFKKTHAIKLNIDIKDIKIESENKAAVEYFYNLKFQLELETGFYWKSREDVDRIVLKKEQDKWKIVSGL